MNATEVQALRPDVDALAWLRAALWAPEADVTLAVADRTDPTATWLARPHADDPELLVPLGSNRAAGAVARRFWDGMPATRRARAWIGEAYLRSGLAQRAWPGRVALTIADADRHDPERSLLAALASRLDAGPLLVAVTMRPRTFNGKPVLAIFTESGAAVAFAKVAVDPLTSEYVNAEIDWLRRAASAALPLRAPRLLDELTWLGRPVAVMEAFDLPRLPRRRAGGLGADLIGAVADLGDRAVRPTNRAGVLVRSRVEAEAGPDDGFSELVAGVVDRHGGVEVDIGGWHGDLSPWNRATSHGALLLWDWELAADGLPVGADLLHEATMVATHLRAATADEAMGPVLDATADQLGSVGVPARSRGAVVDLYLLELARRDRRAARSGRPDDFNQLGAAATRRLHRELGR